MSKGQPRRSNGRSIRWEQTKMHAFASTCKWCGTIVDDGEDDCLMCDDSHDTLPTVTEAFLEAVRYQAEQINAESDEYWKATL